MTLNEYQQHALETAICENRRIIYARTDGRSGQVTDKVRKSSATDTSSPTRNGSKIVKIGDVLCYCATLCCAIWATDWTTWRSR